MLSFIGKDNSIQISRYLLPHVCHHDTYVIVFILLPSLDNSLMMHLLCQKNTDCGIMGYSPTYSKRVNKKRQDKNFKTWSFLYYFFSLFSTVFYLLEYTLHTGKCINHSSRLFVCLYVYTPI